MFKLGEIQRLTIVKKTEHGVYLAEGRNSDERVLLPGKEVPEDARMGSELEVFLYKDSQDRLIATLTMPKVKLHEVALLTVKDVGKIGAFADWGLAKDLLLPFKNQTKKVHPGEECLVALFIDKSSRLCLTMNVYEYLKTDHNYKAGDSVEGRVYLISDQFGAFVAVDDEFSALIPRKELFSEVKVGERITARVTEVKEDGKLSLSIRDKAYLQMDADADKVMKVIEAFDGVLPFNDKASPETIKREFNMSKNEFKRAVGRLYKARKIIITEKNIKKA